MSAFSRLFARDPGPLLNPAEGFDDIDEALDAVASGDWAAFARHLDARTPHDALHWLAVVASGSGDTEFTLPDDPAPAEARAAGGFVTAWLSWRADICPDDPAEDYVPIGQAAVTLLARADQADPSVLASRLTLSRLVSDDADRAEDLGWAIDDLPPCLMAAHLRMAVACRRHGGSQAAMWRLARRLADPAPSAGWLGLIAMAHLEDIRWHLALDPDKAARKAYRSVVDSSAFRAEAVALNHRFLDRAAAEGPSTASERRYGHNALACLMVQLGEGGHALPHLKAIGDRPMHQLWGGPVHRKTWNRVRGLAMLPPLRP